MTKDELTALRKEFIEAGICRNRIADEADRLLEALQRINVLLVKLESEMGVSTIFNVPKASHAHDLIRAMAAK